MTKDVIKLLLETLEQYSGPILDIEFLLKKLESKVMTAINSHFQRTIKLVMIFVLCLLQLH
jgi:hypothetical protein